jgi:aldehyde dehydrogenase (NAD+)
MDIAKIVETQRQFFQTGQTRDVQFRISALKKLQNGIRAREEEIAAALRSDLGKAAFESYLTETAIVLAELSLFLKKIRLWAKPRRVKTPLILFSAQSRILPEPFGVTLIMSPWNYPFQLAINPLIGAIAAGNTAVVKPASYAPATSRLIADLVAECFDPAHVTTVLGGREENAALLDQRFDFIFFTGSTNVGKVVLEKAAPHLTPVCLELGGKSPCLIDRGVDLGLVAKRIAFGKMINAGQSCVAPDYVLIPWEDRDHFVEAYREAIRTFLGPDPLRNPDYPKIITAKHVERLKGLLHGERCVLGGDSTESKIAPTLIIDVKPDSLLMQEEIFGPILPILTYERLEEALEVIRSHEKPLAFYLFTKNRILREKLLREVPFGGATVNDTMMHFASSELGFGGVGHSGMGRYHGKQSFLTFSNPKGIVDRSTRIDLPFRYHPYSEAKRRVVKKIIH